MKWIELQPGDAVFRGKNAYVVVERSEQHNPIGTTWVSVRWASLEGITEGYLSHDEINLPVVLKKG